MDSFDMRFSLLPTSNKLHTASIRSQPQNEANLKFSSPLYGLQTDYNSRKPMPERTPKPKLIDSSAFAGGKSSKDLFSYLSTERAILTDTFSDGVRKSGAMAQQNLTDGQKDDQEGQLLYLDNRIKQFENALTQGVNPNVKVVIEKELKDLKDERRKIQKSLNPNADMEMLLQKGFEKLIQAFYEGDMGDVKSVRQSPAGLNRAGEKDIEKIKEELKDLEGKGSVKKRIEEEEELLLKMKEEKADEPDYFEKIRNSNEEDLLDEIKNIVEDVLPSGKVSAKYTKGFNEADIKWFYYGLMYYQLETGKPLPKKKYENFAEYIKSIDNKGEVSTRQKVRKFTRENKEERNIIEIRKRDSKFDRDFRTQSF